MVTMTIVDSGFAEILLVVGGDDVVQARHVGVSVRKNK